MFFILATMETILHLLPLLQTVIQPSPLIGMADSLDRNSFTKETNKHKTHSNSNSNSNTTHGIESDEGYQSPDLLLHTESEYYDVY